MKRLVLELLKNAQCILKYAKGRDWAKIQESLMEIQSKVMDLADFQSDYSPRQMRFKWEF